MSLKASFTIEASLVMSILLLSVVSLIQFAYRIHDEVLSSMVLQETVEIARHLEDDKWEDTVSSGQKKARYLMSWEKCQIHLKVWDMGVSGTAAGGKWRKELESHIFNPEKWIRILSLAEE